MSETEKKTEEKTEEKPDLEPFLGLIEHMSRSFSSAITVIANLPEDMTNTIRDDDNVDINRKTDAVFRLGRTYQLLRLIHKLYLDDFAERFFDRPENVKRFMTIMSFLAGTYWAYKDKKLDDFLEVISAINEANSNLEDFLADVISSAFSDEDPDDEDSDDGS